MRVKAQVLAARNFFNFSLCSLILLLCWIGSAYTYTIHIFCILLHRASHPIGIIHYVVFKWCLCFICQLIIVLMHIHMTKDMPKGISAFGPEWLTNMKDKRYQHHLYSVYVHMLTNFVFRIDTSRLSGSEIITSLSYSWGVSHSDLALLVMLWIYRILTWCGAAIAEVEVESYLCWESILPNSSTLLSVSTGTYLLM